MSDAGKGRASRVKTWVLVGSLSLNLLVAGLAVGLVVKGPMGPHDLGFGLFDEALRPEDRRALREALRERSGDLRAARGQMTADLDGVLAALRAEPFDAAKLQAALAVQQNHLTERLQIGTEAIGAYLAGLSREERLAVAARLEERQRHGRQDREERKD